MSLLNSVSPLFYELMAEMSHPVTEDFVGGMLNQVDNIMGVIFYIVFSQMTQRKDNNYDWLLYTLMVIPAVVTFAFAFAKTSYARSDSTSSGAMVSVTQPLQT